MQKKQNEEQNQEIALDEKEKSEIVEIPLIQNLIYVVRGKQVFCFQLTQEEKNNLKCQFGTASLVLENESGHGGRRTLPYVFTEQGISMLSSVLRSEVAVNVSIGIMRIFVEMRKYMANSSLLYNRMNAIEERQITYQNETNERVYHIGASLKDAGKKCFAISLLNDSGVIHGILQRLNITEKENKN